MSKAKKVGFFERVFGSGKGGKDDPSPQEAIQRLRGIEEMLGKKSEFLEKKIETETKSAREKASKNRRAALQALKRKKRYETQLKQIDGTLCTIEYQREALENASTNTEVLKVMGSAAQALKKTHNNLDIDKVHDLMDDVAEQQEIANEISDAISNPVGFGNDMDEDDLMAELEELEQEELDDKLVGVNVPSVPLPSVPDTEPTPARAAAKVEDDDEMKELEMWAS